MHINSHTKHPLVSIITPCYNGEGFLDRYFKSILNQTYPNIELIFINDGSVDKTEQIALSYKNAIEQKGYSYIYIYQENAGQAAAINKGLKVFTGEYLTWPDSDDIMYSNCIEEKVKYLISNPDKSLVLCKIDIVSENDLNKITGVMFRKNTKKEDIFNDLVFYNDIYCMPIGYMIKSDVLLNSIRNREIYCGRGGQNAQMLFPVSYKNKCGFIEKSLCKYVERKDSHSHIENDLNQANIKRLYGYEDVAINSLPINMPDEEKNKYIRQIESIFSFKIFQLANSNGDKQIVNKEYHRLKTLHCADFGITRAYLELNHKYILYFYLLLKSPLSLLNMFKSKFIKHTE